MSPKLTLSLLGALVISAAADVAWANPIPTSTDEARALYGRITSQQCIDHTAPANARVTSTDDARAGAGDSVPAPTGPAMETFIAKDEGEGPSAAFAGDQQAGEDHGVELQAGRR